MSQRLSDRYRRPRKVAMSCVYCTAGLLLAMALPVAAEANRERGGWTRSDEKSVHPSPAASSPAAYALFRGQSEGQEDR